MALCTALHETGAAGDWVHYETNGTYPAALFQSPRDGGTMGDTERGVTMQKGSTFLMAATLALVAANFAMDWKRSHDSPPWTKELDSKLREVGGRLEASLIDKSTSELLLSQFNRATEEQQRTLAETLAVLRELKPAQKEEKKEATKTAKVHDDSLEEVPVEAMLDAVEEVKKQPWFKRIQMKVIHPNQWAPQDEIIKTMEAIWNDGKELDKESRSILSALLLAYRSKISAAFSAADAGIQGELVNRLMARDYRIADGEKLQPNPDRFASTDYGLPDGKVATIEWSKEKYPDLYRASKKGPYVMALMLEEARNFIQRRP